MARQPGRLLQNDQDRKNTGIKIAIIFGLDTGLDHDGHRYLQSSLTQPAEFFIFYMLIAAEAC